jgi:hypothetical protein
VPEKEQRPEPPEPGQRQKPGQRRELDPDADSGPDFAEEHDSMTFADEMPGGPEGIDEPESPKGYAGMD